MTAFSFSKAYGMTAYRIGYAVGPAAFIDHLYSILRFSIQACSAVGQRAAHAVLTGDMQPWLAESTANLEGKRDELVARLNRIPGIRCNTPQGVYFVFPDIRGLGLGSVELAEHVLREGRATGRVLVVDETRRTGGVSEGILAGLVDAGFEGSLSRVASKDSFVPLGAAANLVLVSEDEIEAAALALVHGRASVAAP